MIEDERYKKLDYNESFDIISYAAKTVSPQM